MEWWMKTRILLLLLLGMLLPEVAVRAADAPAAVASLKNVIPFLNVNSDILGPSVFLISNGRFWTVNDAQLLLTMIQASEDARTRDAALADIKKFMAMDDSKYREATTIGSKLVALFGVFSIAPHLLSDYPGWYLFSVKIPVVDEAHDACAAITSFVDAKVIAPGKKIIQNRALSKQQARVALSNKKNLDKNPFPFLFKKGSFLPFSLATAGKALALAGGAVGIAHLKNRVPEIQAAVRKLEEIELNQDQKEAVGQHSGYNGPSVVLYRLKQVAHREEISRAEGRTHLHFRGFETTPAQNFYPTRGCQDLQIRADHTLAAGVAGLNMAYSHEEPGVPHFNEGEFWLPHQIVLLEDVVRNNPRAAFTMAAGNDGKTYGQRLFGDAWQTPAQAVGFAQELRRFKQLLRLLIPSVDAKSDAISSESGVLERALDTALSVPRDIVTYYTTGPVISALKEYAFGTGDPDSHLGRIKLWAWYATTTDFAHAPDALIGRNFEAPKLSYSDLYVCICDMLESLGRKSGTIVVSDDALSNLLYLREHQYAELKPYLFSTVLCGGQGRSDVPQGFKDFRFDAAEQIVNLGSDTGRTLQETLLSGIPAELIFGAGTRSFGPLVSPNFFTFAPGSWTLQQGITGGLSRLPTDQRTALIVARAQKLSPFPFFAYNKIPQVATTRSGSLFLEVDEENPVAASGTTAGRRDLGVADDPISERLKFTGGPDDFPAWMFTTPGKTHRDILPAVLGIHYTPVSRIADYFKALPSEFLRHDMQTYHNPRYGSFDRYLRTDRYDVPQYLQEPVRVSAQYARLLFRYSGPGVAAEPATVRVYDPVRDPDCRQPLDGNFKIVVLDQDQAKLLTEGLNVPGNRGIVTSARQGFDYGPYSFEGNGVFTPNPFDIVLRGVLPYTCGAVCNSWSDDFNVACNAHSLSAITGYSPVPVMSLNLACNDATRTMFIDLKEFVLRQKRSVEFCDFRHLFSMSRAVEKIRYQRAFSEIKAMINRHVLRISDNGFGSFYDVRVPPSMFKIEGQPGSLSLQPYVWGGDEKAAQEIAALEINQLRAYGCYPHPYLRFVD